MYTQIHVELIYIHMQYMMYIENSSFQVNFVVNQLFSLLIIISVDCIYVCFVIGNAAWYLDGQCYIITRWPRLKQGKISPLFLMNLTTQNWAQLFLAFYIRISSKSGFGGLDCAGQVLDMLLSWVAYPYTAACTAESTACWARNRACPIQHPTSSRRRLRCPPTATKHRTGCRLFWWSRWPPLLILLQP